MTVYYITMIALIVGAYLLGNVNVSIIISRFKNRDVRNVGSGNPGTMNMLRSFGIKLGVLTLILDALKGAIPALLGWWLLGKGEMFSFGADKIGLFIGGISVVLGHIFPVFYKFKGGKGVAASIGVCFVAAPIVALIAFAVGVLFILTVKIGSLTSFIMTGIPLIYCSVTAFSSGRIIEGALAALIYLIILIAHHSNFARIFKGEEKQVILFGRNKSANAVQNKDSESSLMQEGTAPGNVTEQNAHSVGSEKNEGDAGEKKDLP